MFKNLVASEGKNRRVANSKTIFFSVLAHSFVLGGAVYAGVIAPQQEEKKQEQVTFVDLKPEEPEPPKIEEEAPPPPPEEAPKPVDAPPPPPKGFQDLVPPTEPPPVIPDVDPNAQAVNVEDFSGVGSRGGTSTGVTQGGTPTNVVPKDTTPVFTVEETGVRPEMRNQREVIRLLERQYPRAYADAGVMGQVMLRFMIDEEGKVPPSSITVVTATNDAFGEAAKRVAERIQFKPIKYRGSFVRVWATMPINFQPPS